MVIAWLMAASVGILMPRYMKKTWVGKKFMKKDLWFVVRQTQLQFRYNFQKSRMVSSVDSVPPRTDGSGLDFDGDRFHHHFRRR